jgi:hypothetical protein
MPLNRPGIRDETAHGGLGLAGRPTADRVEDRLVPRQ